MKSPRTVSEYIAGFPPPVRTILRKVRATIRSAIPDAEEIISYGIAGYRLNRNAIYFAAFKNHVSVYPAPRGHADFQEELKRYKGGKGTVQFPLDKPIPYGLIRRIALFRAKGAR